MLLFISDIFPFILIFFILPISLVIIYIVIIAIMYPDLIVLSIAIILIELLFIILIFQFQNLLGFPKLYYNLEFPISLYLMIYIF